MNEAEFLFYKGIAGNGNTLTAAPPLPYKIEHWKKYGIVWSPSGLESGYHPPGWNKICGFYKWLLELIQSKDF